AFLDSDMPGAGDTGEAEGSVPTGRRRRRAAAPAEAPHDLPAEGTENGSGGTGRRRGRPAEPGAGGADTGDGGDGGDGEGV
ncbi:hypothetical protein GT346_03160, partial [Streptomyces sp. SID161]|nr:hypothetical protein [Streptomyces sp. SID161]